MDLYNKPINEFVNWSTGQDELTESQITTNPDQKISGESIRNLITGHLQKPFVTYEDTRENKIYFFSSNDAKALWEAHRNEENNTKYANLVLYQMTKPSDYVLELDDEFLEKENRYIVAGSSGLAGAMFQTKWKIKLGNSTKQDTLEVSYEIVSGKGKRTSSILHSTSGAGNIGNINIDTTDMLEEGINTVTINMWGINTGVTATIVQYVHVVVFDISSSFEYTKIIPSDRDSFEVPVTLTRNEKGLVASIFVYIDGELAFLLTAPVNASNDTYRITIQNPIVQLSTQTRKYNSSYIDVSGNSIPVTHVMQIWATTTIDGVPFRTNLLYYTFSVKSDQNVASYIIPINTQFPSNIHDGYMSELRLYGTQYMPLSIDWGYITDLIGLDQTVRVIWKMSCVKDGLETLREIEVDKGALNADPNTLTFIPVEYNYSEDDSIDKYDTLSLKGYVVLYDNNLEIEALTIPLTIYKSTISISEPSGYDILLSAYNKNNQSEDKSIWQTTGLLYNVDLNDIQYNDNSGWYDRSLRLKGTNQYALLTYNAFEQSSSTINNRGLTIEFEFESEKVTSTDDVILTIGSDYVNPLVLDAIKPVRIEVTPNSAILYDNTGTPLITTNFKQNERIKLCFIINPTGASDLVSQYDRGKVYIVSNGILERASLWSGSLEYDDSNLSDIAKGKITIGKSESGIKFYSLRIWKYALRYQSAYENYVYDNENKNKIFLNNDILVDGTDDISYEKCLERLNTILIKEVPDSENSDFSQSIFVPGYEKEESITNGILELYSREDGIDNVTVYDCLFRKHGQSTIKYPVPSLKVWFGKKYNASKKDIPLLTCANLENLGLNKNRYKMRTDSIPANKYILLANYADSSGCHNGSIQRLIQRCWYNANIDGRFKLRTPPQLFSTISKSEKNNYPEAQFNGKVWDDYFSTAFPYQIRNAADSFPCVVFYEEPNGNKRYLGQYVFMDDKKSDFTYGERSIYKADPNDPFCLKTINKDKDTNENLIWDNKDVLRIEVLNVNDLYTSYMTFEKDGKQFDDVIQERVGNVDVDKFKWELNFELIYPDPDDVEYEKINEVKTYTKFNPNSKFRRVTKPFVDWVKWLTDTRNNYNRATEWWDAGLYSSALDAFNDTAADHLDLWKMAAYYIFMLRFALTDSGERNAQIKTYDGVHFHYEPWDMDIALGNKNDGGIAFTPPVDRNTLLEDGSYAISGKSRTTSNWLWDALEGYSDWADTIVPKVANALYNAGLTYQNCIDMFDGEYSDKWNETIYNKSGYFKYIESGGNLTQYLNWLQGARKPHRHWWLSTSMNYYDAKWECGTFKNKAITFYAGHVAGENEENIIIGSSTPTYVSMVINQGATKLGTQRVDSNNLASYNIGSQTMNYKVPSDIYGAVNIEHLDFSCVGGTFNRIQLESAYDEETGARLKTLNIGVRITDTNDPNIKEGPCNVANDGGITGGAALLALEVLNVRGLRGGISSTSNIYSSFSLLRNESDEKEDLVNVKEFYGMGAKILQFYSSFRGNDFSILELPSDIVELDLRNTTWNNIEFWDAEIGTVSNIPENADENDEITYLPPGTGVYTKHSTNGDYSLNIPSTLRTVRFNGTTGHNEKSKEFVLGWINSIIASLGDNPTLEQIDAALSSKYLYMDDVDWTSGTGRTLLTFELLSLIAKMNHHLKGYILLESDSNNPLSSSDLNNIISWFGNSVFSKSSGDLIIDYNLDKTIVNVSGESKYFYLDENIPCVREGGYCVLNATKFRLRQDTTSYVWKLREPNSGSNGKDTYRGCSIKTLGRSTIMQVDESSQENDYLVEVFTIVEGETVSINIKVIVSTYPTLTVNKTYASDARISGNAYSLYENGSSVGVYISATGETTVSIQRVEYSIFDYQNETTTSLGRFDLLPESYQYLNSTNLKYKKLIDNDVDGIMLCSDILNNDSAIYKYKLICSIYFKAKTVNLNKDIYVSLDRTYILDGRSGSALSNAIYNMYYDLYGNYINLFYKIDLLNISGPLDLTENHNLADLLTEVDNTIFLYLPNITSVDMSYCTGLLSLRQDGNGNNVNQLNFSNMSSLLSLNIEGCTGLTEDIDLRDCPNLSTVKASGTNINVLIPEDSGITTYELGMPTEVSIVRPTDLVPAGISVDGYKNITDLEIIKSNSLTCNAYGMFGKVMENYFGRMLFGYTFGWVEKNMYDMTFTGSVFDIGIYDLVHQIVPSTHFIINAIKIPTGRKIRVETNDISGNLVLKSIYNNGLVHWDFAISTNPRNFEFTGWLADDVYIMIVGDNISSDLKILDPDTDEVLFEWRK